MPAITTETGRNSQESGNAAKGQNQKRSLKRYLPDRMQIWINILLESQRDELLSRGRHQPVDEKHDNYRNGYRPRTINFFGLGWRSSAQRWV